MFWEALFTLDLSTGHLTFCQIRYVAHTVSAHRLWAFGRLFVKSWIYHPASKARKPADIVSFSLFSDSAREICATTVISYYHMELQPHVVEDRLIECSHNGLVVGMIPRSDYIQVCSVRGIWESTVTVVDVAPAYVVSLTSCWTSPATLEASTCCKE